VHLLEACSRQNFWRFWRASDAAHQNAFVFTAQYAKIFPQVFLTSQIGEAASPNPTEKICRHITLFLGNTLLDIFKRQLFATLVPLLCQKCGSLSAEVGAALRSFRDC
jgi:hypothetical protein